MAVTPATGKTHTRYARFLAGGYDLSGDMRAIGEVGAAFESADTTGWTDDTKQYYADRGDAVLTGVSALFNNESPAVGPVLAGAHTVLSPGGAFYCSVGLGIRAAPAIGDPAFSAAFEQGKYAVNGSPGEPVMLSADYRGSALLPGSTAVFGVLLANGAELSVTGQGGSVDNGAASTGGYIAFLHLPQTAAAMASNNWTFVIEHGTNDSAWSTLATFTANGSAITAERQEGSGTVNRYVRFKYTRTAGTARPWVTFIRK